MARVTVEDCVEIVSNRFELVVVAAQRAKQIASGAPLTIDRDNDKDAVVSLREIADRSVQVDELREETIVSFTTRQMSEAYTMQQEEATEESSSTQGIASEVDEAFEDVMQSADEQEQEISGHMSFEDEEIKD